jgi:hypothetical protein
VKVRVRPVLVGAIAIESMKPPKTHAPAASTIMKPSPLAPAPRPLAYDGAPLSVRQSSAFVRGLNRPIAATNPPALKFIPVPLHGLG